ncbi:hypothetical protein BST97_10850 [Nonlabens spongiae]|uniref:Uncharacterized protein n=1 Tax=Nonlabens spongiae TaxID=331648 RepID=A0A1W6MPC0_9FLAO|nr:hypothetical protein BST97_10850 [Nonlabens spongiae]
MKFLYSVLIIFSIISCESEKKPKISYEDENKEQTLGIDSTYVPLASNPIHIDSTEYLMHLIGEFRIPKSQTRYGLSKSSYGYGQFKISNFNGLEITGDINNIKFQKLGTEDLYPLTDAYININSIRYASEINNNIQKQFLIYKINDQDTNQDEVLNYNDVESLYISDIDGTGFEKISPPNHELIDYQIWDVNNRLYYRTIEDSNKNGDFDVKDSIHFYYLDFSIDVFMPVEYNPVN